MQVLFFVLLLGCANAQFVKTAKGGYGASGFQNHTEENLMRLFGHNYHIASSNETAPVFEQSICNIEIPTAQLYPGQAHVPRGNGSRPDLSRVRTCCKGYEKNIYNPSKCDPICTEYCLNGLCTAPETCTCYSDHVRNLAGYCITKCPIGCQNGRCSGGECVCNPGFKLDRDGLFCIPICKNDCGGLGNCTAPNVCNCKPGYLLTPDGSCGSSSPCQLGYTRDEHGQCIPQCQPPCGVGSSCIQPNVCNPSNTRPNANPSSRYPYHNTDTTTQIYSSYDTPKPLYPFNQVSPYPYPTNTNYPVRQDFNQSVSQGSKNNTNNTYGQVPQYGQNPPYNQYPQNSQYPHYIQNPQNGLFLQNNQNPLNGQYPQNNQNPQNGQYPQNNQNPQNGQYPQNNQYPQNGPFRHNSQYPQNGQYPQTNQYPQNAQYPQNSQYPQNGQYPQTNQYPQNSQHPQNNYYPQSSQYPQNNQYDRNSQNLHNWTYSLYNNESSSYNINRYNSSHQANNFDTLVIQYPNQNGLVSSNQVYNANNTHSTSQNSYYNQYPTTASNLFPNNHSNPFIPDSRHPQPYPGNNPYSNEGGRYPQGFPRDHYGSEPVYQEIPYCSRSCVNGFCVATDTCSCMPGYVFDSTDISKTRCIPYCAGGCHNGVCSAPNMCICNPGYRKDHGVKGRAQCVKTIR